MQGNWNMTAAEQKAAQAERLMQLAERKRHIAQQIGDAVLLRKFWNDTIETAEEYLKRIGLSDIH